MGGMNNHVKTFLSTLSLRRATLHLMFWPFLPSYFYPRSPCGERPPRGGSCYLDNIISIHALLAESDLTIMLYNTSSLIFLSTLSLRRATRLPTALRTPHQRFLSTLSLRRATAYPDMIICTNVISIHALLAESDLRHCTTYLNCSRFLSTLSLRRATNFSAGGHIISQNFYPRSPCGERLEKVPADVFYSAFLSTLSLRRATLRHSADCNCHSISIHALLAESDSKSAQNSGALLRI